MTNQQLSRVTFLSKKLFEKSYSQVFRVSLIDKFCVANTFLVPKITKIVISVLLKNLDDPVARRVIAAFFLVRLLTAKKPFLVDIRLFQTFNKKVYTVAIQSCLRRKKLFSFFSFFNYNMLKFLTLKRGSIKYFFDEKNLIVNFFVKQFNFMRLIETHSTFFKWSDKVVIRLWIENVVSIEEGDVVLSLFKFVTLV